MNAINLLFQPTKCPDIDLLKCYCQDLLPTKMMWQIENHVCDCELCSTFIDQYGTETDILDNLDATFAVQLFLRETECQPIAEYELMLDMVLMSAANAIITAPISGDMLHTNEVTFSWADSKLKNLQLSIENNLYEVLFEGEISNGSILPLPPDEYRNGIYYYKLINGDDLLKIGKFYLYR